MFYSTAESATQALWVCQWFRLRNDLYCVKWDVKLYYTVPANDTVPPIQCFIHWLCARYKLFLWLWLWLWQRIDLLYITAVMVHFRYYKKKRNPCCSHPCTDQGEIEPISVLHAATDLCQFSSRLVNIWENGDQKNLFLAYNRGQPCLCMGYGRQRMNDWMNGYIRACIYISMYVLTDCEFSQETASDSLLTKEAFTFKSKSVSKEDKSV